ncbi:hypothetical protein Bbelb_172990 [Branchiostoma belcheri]|nr:hypothetical protein Bbelb_172990 [Branchiostoma belcheri]
MAMATRLYGNYRWKRHRCSEGTHVCPVFNVHYLGVMPANGEVGRGAIEEPVDMLFEEGVGRKLEPLTVSVCSHGLKLKQERGPFQRNKQAVFPIHTVTYGASDRIHPNVFGVVVRNAQMEGLLQCHAFFCDSHELARVMTFWLTIAFKEAFETWQKARLPVNRPRSPGVLIEEPLGVSDERALTNCFGLFKFDKQNRRPLQYSVYEPSLYESKDFQDATVRPSSAPRTLAHPATNPFQTGPMDSLRSVRNPLRSRVPFMKSASLDNIPEHTWVKYEYNGAKDGMLGPVPSRGSQQDLSPRSPNFPQGGIHQRSAKVVSNFVEPHHHNPGAPRGPPQEVHKVHAVYGRPPGENQERAEHFELQGGSFPISPTRTEFITPEGLKVTVEKTRFYNWRRAKSVEDLHPGPPDNTQGSPERVKYQNNRTFQLVGFETVGTKRDVSHSSPQKVVDNTNHQIRGPGKATSLENLRPRWTTVPESPYSSISKKTFSEIEFRHVNSNSPPKSPVKANIRRRELRSSPTRTEVKQVRPPSLHADVIRKVEVRPTDKLNSGRAQTRPSADFDSNPTRHTVKKVDKLDNAAEQKPSHGNSTETFAHHMSPVLNHDNTRRSQRRQYRVRFEDDADRAREKDQMFGRREQQLPKPSQVNPEVDPEVVREKLPMAVAVAEMTDSGNASDEESEDSWL